MLCDQNQSLQQMIYNLYTTLHLIQLKGYSVMQFSWMLLQTYGKGILLFILNTMNTIMLPFNIYFYIVIIFLLQKKNYIICKLLCYYIIC